MYPAENPQSLNLDITAPSLAGRFGVDPMTFLLGQPLSEVMEPFMRGPTTRQGKGRQATRTFPVQVAPGLGLVLPIKALGEVGIHNKEGNLVLTVPALVERAVVGMVHPYLVGKRKIDVNGTPLAELMLEPPKGAALTLPLGPLGKLTIQVA